jgi:secondary thiamine-phosphate synthase enzyme
VRLHKKRLHVPTRSRCLIDITGEIQKAIGESQVLDGIVNIFIPHTSASLLIQENADPKVLIDLERFLGDLVPDGDERYQHTEEGPDDMSAHVRSMLTASTLTVPLESGKLGLGQWQAVYLWEHRHARDGRIVQLSILGDG